MARQDHARQRDESIVFIRPGTRTLRRWTWPMALASTPHSICSRAPSSRCSPACSRRYPALNAVPEAVAAPYGFSSSSDGADGGVAGCVAAEVLGASGPDASALS